MLAGATFPDAIGTLRLRGGTDTPASRLAVTSVVERMDWRCAGGSPRAILLVRRLVGTLETASPPDAFDFEARLRDEIDGCWRSAVPLDGRVVPATARAVFARDLIELLAAYLVDCRDGVASHRWWWRSIGRRHGLYGSVAETLAEHAGIAPQVITEIVRRHRRGDVLTGLSDAEARWLITAIAAAHDLRDLTDMMGERGEGVSRPPAAIRRSVYGSGVDEEATELLRPGAAPRLLVALAHRLVDAPTSVRSFRGVAELITKASGENRTGRKETEPSDRPAASATGARRIILRDAVSRDPSVPDSPDEVFDVAAVTPHTMWNDPPGSPHSDDDGDAGRPLPAVRAALPVIIVERTKHSPGSTKPAEYRTAHAESGAVEIVAGETENEDGVVSALGGVFFLVNFTRQLDFPDVFEPEWKLSSTVGAWGVLELLARSLLPFDVADELDPIWQVLADLGGGRGGLERSRMLPARRSATIPVAWPTTGITAQDVSSIDDTLARGVRQGARRLFGAIAPPMGRILAESLDCRIDELPDVLFRRPARLWNDRTHVEIHLPLESATVPVRRAGLDRDPGWVPTFGRVITFHFDSEVLRGSPG